MTKSDLFCNTFCGILRISRISIAVPLATGKKPCFSLQATLAKQLSMATFMKNANSPDFEPGFYLHQLQIEEKETGYDAASQANLCSALVV